MSIKLPENQSVDESKQSILKTCFVIMPIADNPDYPQGHFDRVYTYIIKPACEKAGFSPYRADDTIHSNTIILDILKRIVEADMAICDLSSRNPNVMYELGIRQAFDLPVVLIKDDLTSRVFDTQHLRDVPYEHTLRIDAVTNAVSKLANALNDTEKHKDDSDSRSLISLLGIKAAKVPEKHEVSMETSIILDEIKSLKLQVNNSSLSIRKSLPKDPEQKTLFLDPNLLNALVMDDRLSGRKIEHNLYGKGIIITYDQDKMVIEFQSFGKMVFDADDFHGLRLLNEKE